MAKAKLTWWDGLLLFQDWWFDVTEYANLEGDHYIDPFNFYESCQRVLDFIEHKAKVDPTPFHEIASLVKRREGIIGHGIRHDTDPHATLSDIHNAIWRSLPAKDRLRQLIDGKVKKCTRSPAVASGRPRQTTTDRAIELLNQGLDNSAVLERLPELRSVGNVRTIKSRAKADGTLRVN